MVEALKHRLLRLLKVPAEPEDPLGAGGSLLVFRAAPNYLRYKLILWAIFEVFLALMLGGAALATGFASLAAGGGFERGILSLLGGALLAGLAFQAVFSYLVVRLDYEMRWYKVTDQSLRIREGVIQVREMTMTFANIQNISISQGPIQGALGLADLKVESAGGGAARGPERKKPGVLDMHTAYFRGVDNAEHIRDLMRQRLRDLRDAGLGDPDEAQERPEAPAPAMSGLQLPADLLAGLQAEAAAFRRAAEALAGRPAR